VSIFGDDEIDDLRERVHESRKSHRLRGFDAADLELWKVSSILEICVYIMA
jgi:hypothetical protein